MSAEAIKKSKPKKQNVVQLSLPVNMSFQELVSKIQSNPENYKIEGSVFDLKTKSSIYSQAVAIGLQYLIDHPKQAPSSAQTNLFAQAVAQSLLPLIDSRLKTLFEATIANYINNKSTNLYVKNIMLALSQKFPDMKNVSINKLCAEINRNIDFILEKEKKDLLKSHSSTKDKTTK